MLKDTASQNLIEEHFSASTPCQARDCFPAYYWSAPLFASSCILIEGEK